MPTSILVVDNDAMMRQTLVEALGAGGFSSVSEAPDLETALHVLLREPWDLVLIDSLHPVWNDDAIAGIRQMVKAAAGTPVILVTGHLQAAELDLAEEGLAGVLPKPFDLEDLLDLIRTQVRA